MKIKSFLTEDELNYKEEMKGLKPDISKEDIIAWFKSHPYPDDLKDIHTWSEKMGWNNHKLENIIFSLLTDYVLGRKR
jgi:hypothetical protein